jgi:hypothetical protein
LAHVAQCIGKLLPFQTNLNLTHLLACTRPVAAPPPFANNSPL